MQDKGLWNEEKIQGHFAESESVILVAYEVL